MTDQELLQALRGGRNSWDDDDAAADRIEQLAATCEQLVKERDDLRNFDDYFRSVCGFKRDGRDSSKCLDEFLAGINRQDIPVPFDHFLQVLKERDDTLMQLGLILCLKQKEIERAEQAEAKLTECEARLSKAVEVLQWYADFGNHVSETGEPAITFDMGGKAEDVLVELGEDIG